VTGEVQTACARQPTPGRPGPGYAPVAAPGPGRPGGARARHGRPAGLLSLPRPGPQGGGLPGRLH